MLPRIRKKFRNRPDQSNLCFVCTETGSETFVPPRADKSRRQLRCAHRKMRGPKRRSDFRGRIRGFVETETEAFGTVLRRARSKPLSQPLRSYAGKRTAEIRPQLRASRFTKVRDNGTGRMRRRGGNPARGGRPIVVYMAMSFAESCGRNRALPVRPRRESHRGNFESRAEKHTPSAGGARVRNERDGKPKPPELSARTKSISEQAR